jgi:hypothetical protein
MRWWTAAIPHPLARVREALQAYDHVIMLAQTEPPAIAAAFLTQEAASSHMRLYRVNRTGVVCPAP